MGTSSPPSEAVTRSIRIPLSSIPIGYTVPVLSGAEVSGPTEP